MSVLKVHYGGTKESTAVMKSGGQALRKAVWNMENFYSIDKSVKHGGKDLEGPRG